MLHLPLLIHTGKEGTFISARDELCDPRRLRLPLDRGVTIIAAHMATSGLDEKTPDSVWLQQLFAEPKYKDLLFADVSATTQFNRIKSFVPLVKDPVFKDRLLYGTDWPLIEARFMSINLSPYHLYDTRLFNSILTKDQIHQLDSYSNVFDKEVLLIRFLGVPEDVFHRADQVLNLP
jgi:hypothetical protein